MSLTAPERATELLADLNNTLEVDGYGISVEAGDPGLHIVVSAQPGACEDCLVPVGVFRDIVTSYLEAGGLVGEPIQVTYPSVASH